MTDRPAVVFKLSGEALGKHRPLDGHAIEDVCRQIIEIAQAGIRVGIVIGGGNVIRGGESWAGHGLPREVLDTWGMRATVMNALALQDQIAFTSNLSTVVVAKPGPASGGVTHWRTSTVTDARHDVVIVGGGLGQFGISTDVAAPELARDMRSSLIVMAKHGVDYIYTADPNHVDHRLPRPEIVRRLTAGDALTRGLRVMDHEAVRRCRKYGITVHVVGAGVANSLCRTVLEGEDLGSVMWPRRLPALETLPTVTPATRPRSIALDQEVAAAVDAQVATA